MDVKTLARLAGVNPQSVVEHKALQGAHLLRIDLRNEPELSSSLAAKATRLPDGDIFTTEFTLDGASQPFVAESMEKYRNNDFHGEDDLPRWGWRLRAQIPAPNARFGAEIERISLWMIDEHSGSEHQLGIPIDSLQRPWMSYSLGYRQGNYLNVAQAVASAGSLELHHEPDGENSMRLSGTFSGVRFEMPNCHEHLPQAPDRPFTVLLPVGFYELKGSV